MSLERTLAAVCDHPSCTTRVRLNPDHTQPYVALTSLGWGVKTTDHNILTYCPDHGGDS